MRHRMIGFALVCTLAAGFPIAAQTEAPVDDEAAIKYRQHLMSSIGGDMGAIADILKFGLPFRENIAVHAGNIQSSATLIASAFEAPVTDGLTDAKPEIWQKPDLFTEKIQALEREAAKLAELAKNADAAALGAQTKALGDACGGCHESFRKPKEESYKRLL